MQLTQGILSVVKSNYAVTGKKIEKNGVELFESDTLGTIVARDEKVVFCERDRAMRYEMLVHVPMCLGEAKKNVLIIGGNTLAAAIECAKHPNISIDIADNDAVMLEIVTEAGLQLPETVQLHTSDGLEFTRNAADQSYDLVIVETMEAQYGDKVFMAHLGRILNTRGIAVFNAGSWFWERPYQEMLMKALGQEFGILMPYRYDTLCEPSGQQMAILASKFWHPAADINLQRADLTENLTWYNGDLHLAAFALATADKKELLSLLKL